MTLTKNDKIYIENLFNRQTVKFENKIEEQEIKFEEKITKFKDEFYTKIDPILKEVVASREDRLIGTEQHIRSEKRIEKLEKIHPHSKHAATI